MADVIEKRISEQQIPTIQQLPVHKARFRRKLMSLARGGTVNVAHFMAMRYQPI